MAGVASREAYFETGLEVLADNGFGGLKLAMVCSRLGVTTGSFYHYFPSWGHYTRELIEHWRQATHRRVEGLRAISDPRARIDKLIQVGLSLPHDADAAIRTWASVDQNVATAQVGVDAERFEVIRDAAKEILGDDLEAAMLAKWAVYLLTGYEQSTLPHDRDGLAWMFRALTDSMHNGNWARAVELTPMPKAHPDRD